MGESPAVLVVEDDEVLARVLVRALSKLDARVESVPSAEHALEWIALAGPPAVVVTDLRMGPITGLDLIRRLATVAPKTRCVLHTGESQLALDLDAISCLTIVTKPSSEATMRSVVGWMLSSGPLP